MDGFRHNISRFTLYKEYPDCSLENSLEGEQAWKLGDQIILAVVWEMFNAFFIFKYKCPTVFKCTSKWFIFFVDYIPS